MRRAALAAGILSLLVGCSTTGRLETQNVPVYVPEPGPALLECPTPQLQTWTLEKAMVVANPSLWVQAMLADLPNLVEALERCNQQIVAHNKGREEVLKKRQQILDRLGGLPQPNP